MLGVVGVFGVGSLAFLGDNFGAAFDLAVDIGGGLETGLLAELFSAGFVACLLPFVWPFDIGAGFFFSSLDLSTLTGPFTGSFF